MKVKAVKVNRAHYFLTDPRTSVKESINICRNPTRCSLIRNLKSTLEILRQQLIQSFTIFFLKLNAIDAWNSRRVKNASVSWVSTKQRKCSDNNPENDFHNNGFIPFLNDILNIG